MMPRSNLLLAIQPSAEQYSAFYLCAAFRATRGKRHTKEDQVPCCHRCICN